jgi:hypothetical protein
MESYCSLYTFKVPQGAKILCTLDTIHRLFFVTRVIILEYDWNNIIAMQKWNIFKGKLFSDKIDYVLLLKKVIVTNNDCSGN